MSSPTDNLTTTTATPNHHDIDVALSAPNNNVLDSVSVNVLDPTMTTMPFMFSSPFSRQSSSTTAAMTPTTPTTPTPTPTTMTTSPNHLSSYSASFSDYATASGNASQSLYPFPSSSSPSTTLTTSTSQQQYPTTNFSSASNQNHNHDHHQIQSDNNASLLTTGGEAQVPKTVVIDNLLEKVMRTTQDARDAFTQSRSQDGIQRLAELKAVVDLVVSFVSSSSKPSPPGLSPLTSFVDSYSHPQFHSHSHPHPQSHPHSHQLQHHHSHSHSHSHSHPHPYHVQPPSQRVSPTGVTKSSSSSSSSRKPSLNASGSGPGPQLIPSSLKLEDASRKRCASPQNDRTIVKSLKLESKEDSLVPLPPSLATSNSVTPDSVPVPVSDPSSVAPVIPPQLVHSKTYPPASSLHPSSHSHSHSHPHSHPHSHFHSHSHSHNHAPRGPTPLSRIASYPSLESLATSSMGVGSVSNAAMAHQLNLLQQQQQHQHQHHPIPLGHTHSLSTSHIPTVHSSFLATNGQSGQGGAAESTASSSSGGWGSESSILQPPIQVPSSPSPSSSSPSTTGPLSSSSQSRFHHLNPNFSTPPLTRPTRSASHSGALSFSFNDFISSSSSMSAPPTGAGGGGSSSTTSKSTPTTEVDMIGVVVNSGTSSEIASASASVPQQGSGSSGIEVPPPPLSAANSSTPGSDREDSPGRLYNATTTPGGAASTASGGGGGGRATDSFVTTHQNSEISPELKTEVDRIFFEFMNMVCSDLDAKDSKGEPIHQPLMAKKMQRLDESRDFRPFKFRIQAFTNGFLEELAKQGLSDDIIPMKKVRHYLWTNPYISRFNEDGKKAKSKGNHIWNIDARRASDSEGGGWIFRPFRRKIAGTFPNIAYVGILWQFRPRVWDPQASRSNLHQQQEVRFTSPNLPSWLSWNGDTLSGTPGPDAQSVEFTIEAKEGKETVLSQTYFLSVAPLTREPSTSFSSASNMPPGPRRPSLVNERRISDTAAGMLTQSAPLLSTRSVPTPSTPAALQDALTVVTEAIKAVSLEAHTVQAASHAEHVQIQNSLTRQEQVLTSTAQAMNRVMIAASGSPSSAMAMAVEGQEARGGGGGGERAGDGTGENLALKESRIVEAATLARAGTEVVICAAQKVAADHRSAAANAMYAAAAATSGGVGGTGMMTTSELVDHLDLNLDLNNLNNLNPPIQIPIPIAAVTMEEVSTTTKSAVAEAVERTDTTASPIDVMLAAETIIQQNTQPLAVPVAVPPLLTTAAAQAAGAVPSFQSLSAHGHGGGGIVPPGFHHTVDMSNYDYPMNDLSS